MSTEKSEYAISVKELVKRYGDTMAVDHIDMQLHANEIIGLIGANGSGKTSFFKMCVGLESVTGGTIEILGGNPWEDMEVRSELIYSMHNLPVGDARKLKQIVGYYEVMYPHFDREFAEKLLLLFLIPMNKKYKSLSQGMKSLFHFSCALATRCKVTLLDEPFIGIDIEKRKMAYDILLRDFMEHPRTFVISSHNLSELESVLSEMVLIDEGRIIFYESIDAVREMLYQAGGNREAVQAFADSLPEEEVLELSHGETGSNVIVRGSILCGTAEQAKQSGLHVKAVSPEDVSIVLAGKQKKKELSYLWE